MKASDSVSTDLPAAAPVDRYHPALVVLHWLLAVLLLAALAQGSLALKHVTNASPEKISLLRVHMLVGGSILILMIARIAVAMFTHRPSPALLESTSLTRASRLVHGFLYVLVLSMAGSGIGIAITARLPDIVLGGSGKLPETFDTRAPRALHGLIATVLIVTIAAHVCAALYHQFIRKDGLMRRMSLRRGSAAELAVHQSRQRDFG